MKKALSIILALSLIFTFGVAINAENDIKSEAEYNTLTSEELDINAKSAMLIEAQTGEIIYMKNPDEALPPASVTKIMTLLLVCEALRDGKLSLDNSVTISEHAASMGGSQVFLKVGEKMTVRELLKCTVIASANDCAVALAEAVSGSERIFVSRMNEKAKEMGLVGCSFENVTGLDDTTVNHKMSARDIAAISAELIKYPEITDYSRLWQDSIRDGEFILTNTNRLVRYYDGCTGLKTGSTDKAGYCVTVSAERDNMKLICVIMGASTRDERNKSATALLDFGFANYSLYTDDEAELEALPVNNGKDTHCMAVKERFTCLIKKSDLLNVKVSYDIPETVLAPVTHLNSIGKVTYSVGECMLGEADIYTDRDLEAINLWYLIGVFFKAVIS